MRFKMTRQKWWCEQIHLQYLKTGVITQPDHLVGIKQKMWPSELGLNCSLSNIAGSG